MCEPGSVHLHIVAAGNFACQSTLHWSSCIKHAERVLATVKGLTAYQMIQILNLCQAVVVQLQLCEVDQSVKVVNPDNVLEAKSQMLNVFVTRWLLLLLDVCSSSAGSFQAMYLSFGDLWLAACCLKCSSWSEHNLILIRWPPMPDLPERRAVT